MSVNTRSKCSVWWCNKPHYGKGYCKAHVTAVKRTGSPYGRHREEFERIDDTIERARALALLVLHGYSDTTDDDRLALMAQSLLESIGEESR